MPAATLRRATQADQARIRQIIRVAGINPTGLDWRRFRVAESDGIVIGTGQVKPHRDGSRELASIAVVPTYQRQGIASQLIRALLADQTGPLFLMCKDSLQAFYCQFGFQPVTPAQLPEAIRATYRLIRLIRSLERITGRTLHIIVMYREAPLVVQS